MPPPRQQYFNLHGGMIPSRSNIGNQMKITKPHGSRALWYKTHHDTKQPFAVKKYSQVPRILLDRDLYKQPRWFNAVNMPDPARWEKVICSMRVTEDRWSMAEEEGQQHKVNWKLYSERLRTELLSARENLPQYTVRMSGAPIKWKSFDVVTTPIKGMSVREAMAQGKLTSRKGLQIVYKALEMAQQGAEAKGLDKERLRVQFLSCWRGPTDKQIDIRSKGFYGWKTKESTNFILTVTEDPEMVLPDRTQLPFSSVLAMKKAGLYDEPVVLDVPAITADGI